MNPVHRLMQDLEESIVGSPDQPDCHETTLRRVTDLLLGDIDLLMEDQIDIFDSVIARLAVEIETRARAELARRLAPLAKAPPVVILRLAHDAIEVARPILVHSPRLDDGTLIAVAIARGQGHMQAIAERRHLSEPVTDVLATRGDRRVVHTLAANRDARLSRESAAVLVDQALLDEELQVLLSARTDLPESQIQRLVAIAAVAARRNLAASTPAVLHPVMEQALAKSAKRVRAIIAGAIDYRMALDTIGAIEISRLIDEHDVAGFAENDHLEETICAVASCAELSLAAAERLFTTANSDLVLMVGKAQGWSWATVQVLCRLKDPESLLPHKAKRLKDTYDDLASRTAQRVLRFVRHRDRKIA